MASSPTATDRPKDLKKKAKEISLVLGERDVDLWKLRELALSEGGLVNDSIRKRAWPKLVGLYDYYCESLVRTKAPQTPQKPILPRNIGSASNSRWVHVNSAASSPQRVILGTPQTISSSLPPRPAAPSLAPTTVSDQNWDDVSVGAASVETRGSVRRAGAVPPSVDADQVDRDVGRCTWHLLTGSQRSRRMQMKNKHRKKVASTLRKKQRRLGSLINLTLVRSYADLPKQESEEEDDAIFEEDNDIHRMRYYQGYHDIASIFLSALGGGGPSQPFDEDVQSLDYIAASLGLDLPSRVLHKVSQSHLRDALKANFKELQTSLRLVLMPLIWYFDYEVHAHLMECDMEPFFALSWIITWFSHDVRDTELIKRLFDAFLVSHPLLPMYMSVAMISHPYNRIEVLSTECDFALVHQTLSQLPRNSSMSGWRFKVGDGYVSGDEEEEEGTGADLDTSLMSTEDHIDELNRDDDRSEIGSLISHGTSIGSRHTKVPFEDLLELALTYMRRLPPRSLMDLAMRYYGEEIEPMLDMAPNIVMLGNTPDWGIVSRAPADWVLKQEVTGKKLTRRDRRRRGRSRSPNVGSSGSVASERNVKPQASTPEEGLEYVKRECASLAVIACGYGPGDDEILRKKMIKKKRRRRAIIFGTAAALVLLTCVICIRYRSQPAIETSLQDAEVERQLSQTTTSQEHASTPQQVEVVVEPNGDITNVNEAATQPTISVSDTITETVKPMWQRTLGSSLPSTAPQRGQSPTTDTFAAKSQSIYGSTSAGYPALSLLESDLSPPPALQQQFDAMINKTITTQSVLSKSFNFVGSFLTQTKRSVQNKEIIYSKQTPKVPSERALPVQRASVPEHEVKENFLKPAQQELFLVPAKELTNEMAQSRRPRGLLPLARRVVFKNFPQNVVKAFQQAREALHNDDFLL